MSQDFPDTVPASWERELWSKNDMCWADNIVMTPLFGPREPPAPMRGPAYALMTLLRWDGAVAIDGPRSVRNDEPACLIVPTDDHEPRFGILLPRGRQLIKLGGRAERSTIVEGVGTAWNGDDTVWKPDTAVIIAAEIALHSGLTGPQLSWVQRPIRTFSARPRPRAGGKDDDHSR